MKKVISIPGAPAPIGPYSQAVSTDNRLYVSGQIPIDPHTGKLVSSSIQESTKQVMNNIVSLVEAANFSMTDIVKCSIFLKSMDDFAEVNEVYATYFTELPPARETVQVAKLPLDVTVEISCIALK